jgi:hypothetical protein
VLRKRLFKIGKKKTIIIAAKEFFFQDFCFVMLPKYNHPLVVQIVDTCRKARLRVNETHGQFGKRAGTSKQYIQKLELYNTEPGIIKADELLRASGKKIVIVDINHPEVIDKSEITQTLKTTTHE